MSSKSEDRQGDTVRLFRPAPRVFTDATGRNVWMGEVEVLELELLQAADADPYNNPCDTACRASGRGGRGR